MHLREKSLLNRWSILDYKAMPAYARGDGHSCPTTLGIFAQGVGHAYPRTWSCVPMYVGMSVHVRGYGYSCTWADWSVWFNDFTTLIDGHI